MTTWSERAQHDASLRAYVAAEIGRAVVRLQSIEVELEHARQVIADLQDKLKAAQAEAGTGKKGKK